MVIGFYALIFVLAAGGSIYTADVAQGELFLSLVGLFYLIIYFGIPWLYDAAFESSSLQATPGKLAMGIIVTDLDGNQISFLRATGRHFASFFSYVTLLVGFMMAGFTERKQALHDLIAGCLVVNKG